MINEQQAKKKTKEALLNKLKNLNAKGEPINQPQISTSMPVPQNQPPMKIDTEEDFRKMPYQGKAKYDNQLKALNALKNQTEERNQKPKKMFFEHYDTVEAYCPIIQNNSNPSGRPPNIPPEMYQGITVKPKRPWVYIGTQNLPPVQYQQINENNFKAIQKKNIQPGKQQTKNRKAPGNPGPKPRKKQNQQKMSQFGQQSEISNQIDIGQGQSIFGSRYENDSKYMSSSKRGRMSRNSQYSIADQESENTQTRNKRLNIFESGDNDQYSSQQFDDDSELQQKSKSKNAQKSKKDIKMKKKKQEQEQESDE